MPPALAAGAWPESLAPSAHRAIAAAAQHAIVLILGSSPNAEKKIDVAPVSTRSSIAIVFAGAAKFTAGGAARQLMKGSAVNASRPHCEMRRWIMCQRVSVALSTSIMLLAWPA